MKALSLLLGTVALLFTVNAGAQTAPAKPKPYSAGDARIYLTVADGIQFQLNMALRLRSRYKDGPQDMLDLSSKISKESTELWTPGVDAAMAHGVDGKKIPNGISKNDTMNLNKLGTIKDEKK